MLGELNDHAILAEAQRRDAGGYQRTSKCQALLRGPTAPNIALNHGSRLRLTWTTPVEIAVTQLSESNIYHARVRLHDLGVEIAECPGELLLDCSGVRSGDVDLQVRHGNL
jgi:hypothetical protein